MLSWLIMQLSLIPEEQQEQNRKLLLASIKKKRLLLQRLVVKSEMLKVRLDMLKAEYMVNIGSLVLKDNHLDLEIIQLRNIFRLMNEGKSYDEAVNEISQTFYTEQLEMEKEEEKVRMQKEKLDKREQKKSSELLVESKKLWKRLIALFHPDLTQDTEERKRREAIMKQINQAYEEGDLTRLARIEREHAITHESPIENLEEVLVQIENEIIAQEKFYTDLKQSEWYRWDQKITKSKVPLTDLFKDMEKKLLNDIVAKMEIIKSLEEKITHLR